MSHPSGRVFTVKGIQDTLGRLVDRTFSNVMVEGEVAQINTPASGHAFLLLREGDARLPCVVWANTWRALGAKPAVGDKVLMTGRIGLYAPQGTLQLYANTVRPVGDGELARRLAQIRARLDAEGLLDPRRKRPLPRFPRVVGVATSLTGAALQDFLRVASTRWPARILVAGCQVQGDEAAGSVIRALELLFDHGQAELVVVTRGGGTKLDLLPFHDETLARWIATAPVPIVSAVGHEIDTTLADLAADVVAPTPSAAAVVVLPDAADLRRRVEVAQSALQRGIARQLKRRRDRIEELRGRLRHPSQQLLLARRRATDLEARLHRAMAARLDRARAPLGRAEGRLRALSPLGVLDRGYAIVRDGLRVVRSPDELAQEQRLEVQVAGGRFTVRVDRSGP